jgi:hypothetical protein
VLAFSFFDSLASSASLVGFSSNLDLRFFNGTRLFLSPLYNNIRAEAGAGVIILW